MRPPRRALVCPPPDSYARALTRDADPRPVDVDLARQQHAAYAAALRRTGLAVTELSPDPAYPDACFVQDPAFVLDEILIVARPGEQSRRREARALVAALAPLGLPKYSVVPPATLEGGDVLVTEDRLFVGLSARTNAEAVEQLRLVFARPVVAVPIPKRYLHLLSGCTYLGDGRLLATADRHPHTRYQLPRPADAPSLPGDTSVARIVLLPGRRYYARVQAAIRAAEHRVDVAMFHIAMPSEDHP